MLDIIKSNQSSFLIDSSFIKRSRFYQFEQGFFAKTADFVSEKI